MELLLIILFLKGVHMIILLLLLYTSMLACLYFTIAQSVETAKLKFSKMYDKRKRAKLIKIAKRRQLWLIVSLSSLVTAIITVILLGTG